MVDVLGMKCKPVSKDLNFLQIKNESAKQMFAKVNNPTLVKSIITDTET